MTPLWSLYTRELHRQLKYRGTWFPSASVALGTVGVLRDGVFEPMTSLERLDIGYERRADPVPDGSLDYTSAGAVGVTAKAAGSTSELFKVLAGADAGVLVRFNRAGGVLLQMRGVTVERIEDKHVLAEELLDALFSTDDHQRWRREWVVVTDVVKAERATVIVAQEGGGQLELKARGQVAPANLVDAEAGFGVVDEKGVGVRLLAASGVTPLFNGLRVKRRFWSMYDQVLPANEAIDGSAERLFGDLDPEDDDPAGSA